MSKQRIEEILAYAEALCDCYENTLTAEERAAFHAWEDSPQFTRTDEWPGWERYIGKRPGAQLELVRRRA